MNFWDMYYCLLFFFIRDVCHELLGHVPLFAVFFIRDVYHELLGHVPLFAVFFYKGCLSCTSGTCTIVCYFFL